MVIELSGTNFKKTPLFFWKIITIVSQSYTAIFSRDDFAKRDDFADDWYTVYDAPLLSTIYLLPVLRITYYDSIYITYRRAYRPAVRYVTPVFLFLFFFVYGLQPRRQYRR